MSVSVNDFWNRIADSGLADSNQCRVWAVEFVQGHGAPPTSAKDLAKWLISSNQLTVFQAQSLLGNESSPLVVGNFAIRAPFDQSPLRQWHVALDLANPTGPEQLLHRVSEEHANEFKVGWFRRHARAQSPYLQRITQVETADAAIAFASDVPDGVRLSKQLSKATLSPEQVCNIGRQVGLALAELHSEKVVHGCVHPSRVWLGKDGNATLLRSPICRPTSPLEGRAADSLDSLEKDLPLTAYAAPEFSIPGKQPDESTDLYSLGCLLYQTRFGELPFPIGKPDRLIQLHSTSVPKGLASLHSGDSGESLLRVIAHLMAKNRSARIQSAQQLAALFEAVAKSPTSVPVAQASATAAKPEASKSETAAPPQSAEGNAAQSQSASPDKAARRTKPQPTTDASAAPPPAKRERHQDPPPAKSKAPNDPGPAADAPAAKPKAAPAAPPSAGKPSGSTDPSNGEARKEPKAPEPVASAASPSEKPAAPKTAEPARSKQLSSSTAPKPPVPPAAAAPPVPTTPDDIPEPQAPPPPAAPTPPAAPAPVAQAPIAQAPVATAAPVAASTPAPQALAGSTATDAEDAPKRRRPKGKKKKKKKKAAALVIGGAGFSMLMLLTAVLILINRPSNPSEPDPNPRVAAVNPVTPVAPPRTQTREPESTPSAGGKFAVIDDRYALWLPPDESDPAPLKLLAPGPQMIVSLRPSEILNSPQGRKLMSSLEPELGGGIGAIEKRIGVSLGQVDRLMFSVKQSVSGKLTYSLAVELLDLQPLGELRSKWGDPGEAQFEGQTFFAGDDLGADAFYVAQQPPNDSMTIKRFAVGSIEAIKQVAELQGEDITLARQQERMWAATRGDAHLTVMVLPNFLFADGRSMLENYAPTFLEPLRAVLIPKAQVASFSMNFGTKWFGEIRLMPGTGASAPILVQTLKQEFADLQENAETFLVGTSPHPSWRRMAIKLPRMFDALSSQMRTGVSKEHATANFYLPGNAAYNVIPAALLAMNTPAGASFTAGPAPTAAKPWTMEEMLEKTVSVSFEQEPLHFAGSTVVEEINSVSPAGSPKLRVEIFGNDLQKMGITQNQQIRNFAAKDMKLRDVLTQLAQRANLKKGLTDPKDPEQVLVWLVGPDPNKSTEEIIIFTTRNGAAEKGLTLPKEF